MRNRELASYRETGLCRGIIKRFTTAYSLYIYIFLYIYTYIYAYKYSRSQEMKFWYSQRVNQPLKAFRTLHTYTYMLNIPEFIYIYTWLLPKSWVHWKSACTIFFSRFFQSLALVKTCLTLSIQRICRTCTRLDPTHCYIFILSNFCAISRTQSTFCINIYVCMYIYCIYDWALVSSSTHTTKPK